MKSVIFILLIITFLSTIEGQTRTFYLENYCEGTVWFTMTSGAAPYATGFNKCSGSSGCVAGSTCGGNGICYWNNPEPTNGNYRLDAYGGTNSVVFPFNGQNTVWSGNIGGCLNGTCSADSNVCDTNGCGTFGGSPQTNAEFTLSATGVDFYDVEMINGFNLPVAVYPQTTNFNPANPYSCGSPGSPFALTNTANCSWNFNPPSVYFNWVLSGGSACTSNSDCSNGDFCGLSNNVGKNPRFALTCGTLVGYWTANQVCGIDMSFGEPFNCNQQLPSNGNDNLWDLYACAGGIPSCYGGNAGDNCCGCANWGSYDMFVPPQTAQCVSCNPTWMSDVFPTLVWLKRACPSLYTFPYDDMSSTFTCAQDSGSNNVVNYKIVWCPRDSTN